MLTSKNITETFKKNGISVRVKKLSNGSRFRICKTDEKPIDNNFKNVVGLLDLRGPDGSVGGLINQPYEMFVIAPDCIKYV